MVRNWILYFVNNLKQFFESYHKNTLSMVMFIWSKIVTYVLDAIKVARMSNRGTVTNLLFIGASLDFPINKLQDIEFWCTTFMYGVVL